MLTRFTDVDSIYKRSGIDDYIFSELVSLEKAIQPLAFLVDKIDIHAATAKNATEDISSEDGLTHDEAAAIYLYSMKTGRHSLYRVINATLRGNILSRLKPWFLYLKLIHTALNKLPSQQMRVWRALGKDVSASYKKGMHLIWRSISSCSNNAGVVQNFVNRKTPITLFKIDCTNGKSITKYSHFPSETEIILMPGTQLKVINNSFKYYGLHIVHLEELPKSSIQRKYSILPAIKKSSAATTCSVQQKKNKFIPVKLVPCPHCQTSLEFQSYTHGVKLICTSCKLSFVELSCPYCTKSNYWKNPNDYTQGTKVTCVNCKKTFQHINCPHCNKRNNFKSADCIEGAITKCYKCKKTFQLMNCTHCQAANIWKNANYISGNSVKCSTCKEKFQKLSCPNCNIMNMFSDVNYRQGQRIICCECQKAYQHIVCPHCFGVNYFSNCDYNEGDQIRCVECEEVFQHRQCDACDADSYWKDADYNKTLFVQCRNCQESIPPIGSNEELETNESEQENQLKRLNQCASDDQSQVNEGNFDVETALIHEVMTHLNLKKIK